MDQLSAQQGHAHPALHLFAEERRVFPGTLQGVLPHDPGFLWVKNAHIRGHARRQCPGGDGQYARGVDGAGGDGGGEIEEVVADEAKHERQPGFQRRNAGLGGREGLALGILILRFMVRADRADQALP